MTPPIQKPVRSKSVASCEPFQLRRITNLPLEGLDTYAPPLRRSARLREKNFNRKVDYRKISRRQSPKKTKIREIKQRDQLQQKSKNAQSKKGNKGRNTKRQDHNQPQSLSSNQQIQSQRSRKRDEQEITQRLNKKKDYLIENWLSTVPLPFESLVDPLLQRASENMSSGSESSWTAEVPSRAVASAPGTGFTKSANGVRAPRFRDFLGKRNIFVNDTEVSTKLMKRVTEIITNKEPSSEMDDDLAKELVDQELNLETSQEMDLISDLVIPLILDTTKARYQSLQRCSNKKWSIAVTVRVDPSAPEVNLPRLPRPKPDFVFGYSKTAFNTSQFKASKSLETKSGENYGMPDGKSMFPFLVLECKAQATGGTHFVATNQAATAGAFAMNGALELALRISPEENIDYDEPMFFSITIDHLLACINVHWLSKEAEGGAYCFHMRRILRYILDVGGLKAVSRAIKNILHYGANERLTKIRGQLDMYAQKVKETARLDKGDSAPNLPSEELQIQTHSRKRKTRNQRPQSKRRRSSKADAGHWGKDGEEGEDGEEG